jgi:hypothetical protein
LLRDNTADWNCIPQSVCVSGRRWRALTQAPPVTSVKLVWIRDGVEMPIGAAAPIE